MIHVKGIGDHPRGLFEAEASIAVSAAHFLQNEKIPTVFCHWTVPRLKHCGKPNFLQADQLCLSSRFSVRIASNPQTHKDSPPYALPFDGEYDKGVLHHASRSFMAERRQLDRRVFSPRNFNQRLKYNLAASEFSMGQTSGKQLHRRIGMIFDAPAEQPRARLFSYAMMRFFDRDFGRIVNQR